MGLSRSNLLRRQNTGLQVMVSIVKLKPYKISKISQQLLVFEASGCFGRRAAILAAAKSTLHSHLTFSALLSPRRVASGLTADGEARVTRSQRRRVLCGLCLDCSYTNSEKGTSVF